VVSWFVCASSRLSISIESTGERRNVQPWIIEVLFTYPLIGSVVARVGVALALTMLVIVTILMVFVAV
jgi:hypothetical protein